ncbi:MAG: LuxR C-terminal-related transcriptional regulator [Anaerolineales bacterium]
MNAISSAARIVPPLLRTKFYVPAPRPQLVERPQLLERLDGSVGRRLTLVAAPAGFGKTTLLSAWVHSRRRPVAWLSLDAGDNDPARFWTYVIGALQRVAGDLGRSLLPALQSPQPPPVETLLTGLINALLEQERPLSLILDDYHHIEASPIQESLAFLVEHLPPHLLHLVLAGRTDPPIPLARWRARGQLAELRAADLRFTQEEAHAFLIGVMGLALTPGDVAALETRTEGWITGLQLAALSLQGRRDVRDFVRAFTGSHRYVLDYLVEEVIQRESEEVQTFLLRTAILNRLCAPLCEALEGLPEGEHDDAQEMLEYLEQANLFLVPLDEERRWYRYHHLFGDLLRARARTRPEVEVPILHRRAGRWYEEQGHIDEALHHTLAAGDYERAAEMVEAHALARLTHGQLVTLQRWMEALPEELILRRPWLSTYYAWALALICDLQEVERWLESAASALPPELDEEEREKLLGHAATIRAYAATLEGHAEEILGQGHRALELLPEGDLVARSVVTFSLGGGELLQGNLAAAEAAFAEAGRLGMESGNVHLGVSALATEAALTIAKGELRRAWSTYEETLERSTDAQGELLPFAATVLSGMAQLAYERNEMENAHTLAERGLRLAEQWGNEAALAGLHMTLIDILRAQGRYGAAQQALAKAKAIQSTHTVSPLAVLKLLVTRIRFSLAQEDLPAALQQLQESERLQPWRGLEHTGYLLNVEEARVRLAQGRPGAALEALASLEETYHSWNFVPIGALRALALHMAGEDGAAFALLAEILPLAEREGYVRTFVDQGAPMQALLEEARVRGVRPEYVTVLLREFDVSPTAPPSPKEVDQSALIEALSERQMEVLRHLALGLSNQEIADALYIAESTVKSHVNAILRKLDVDNRTAAVVRAQALGILPH